MCGFVEDDPETVDGGERGISTTQEKNSKEDEDHHPQWFRKRAICKSDVPVRKASRSIFRWRTTSFWRNRNAWLKMCPIGNGSGVFKIGA